MEVLTKDRRNVVRVVTSDWAGQQMVMGSGAIRVSPVSFSLNLREWKHRLIKRQITLKKPLKGRFLEIGLILIY